MNIFEIPENLQKLISDYDKKSYTIWNDMENQEINSFRKAVRTYYLSEQKNTCFYCKQYIFSKNGLHWQVEHILPKSLFPQFLFEPKNLIIICPDCNGPKGNQNTHVNGLSACSQKNYPRSSGRFTIIHPFFDQYQEHIHKIPAKHCDYPDHYFLRGLTPKGKATVKMCDLNRFYQDFAGYKDMTGKQVESLDQFIEDKEINSLSRSDKIVLIQKLTAELA